MNEEERKILDDVLATVQRIEVSANAYHIADVVWDEAATHHLAGSMGEMLSRIDSSAREGNGISSRDSAEYHLKEAMAKVDPANASIIAVAMDQLREVGEIK